MLTAIIISTQTPNPGLTFPQEGGTAYALQHFTGFDAIGMHLDGKAREEEKIKLAKLKNNGIVFITGHGNTEAETLAGAYRSPALPIPQETQWNLKTYRDLILDNSSLKRGDSLTIVLWSCNSGDHGSASSAAQLAKLFQEKGINTRIIASTKQLDRFNGLVYEDEVKMKGLRYRTAPSDIRLFECVNTDEVKEFKFESLIYFTPKGIKTVPSLKAQICDSSQYVQFCDSKSVGSLLSKSSSPFILRPSAQRIKESDCFIFSASFLVDNDVYHTRYRITGFEELEYWKSGVWEPLEIRENVFHTLAAHIEYAKAVVEKTNSDNIKISPSLSIFGSSGVDKENSKGENFSTGLALH
ncbi:hypothetical protein [Legionella sp.]|uniref:hypothetical protein n=1 Tax=Legionella sp. TaxID=459 RepID=UPI003220738C